MDCAMMHISGKSRHCLFAAAIFLWLAMPPFVAAARDQKTEPSAFETGMLLERGGYAVQKEGVIIAARNLDQAFIPASIVKLATGLAAFRLLGPEYHFTTSFFMTPESDLYIQGHGDPFLISEEVEVIADRLAGSGVREVRDLLLDDTDFTLAGVADGADRSDNPYDAENSALAVNFNTVCFTKHADGTIQSAEPQTPTLPLMIRLGAGLAPGTYRLNITAGSVDPEIVARYVGELFQACLGKKGIACRGAIKRKAIPGRLEPMYVHQSSPSILAGLEKLMRYSNNFIANQIFLACGMKRFGAPATWRKAGEAVEEIMRENVGIGADELLMVEGSGLSRRNRVTPRAMLRVLDSLKPYGALLPSKEIHGRKLFVKSGTLSGVFSYAGYFVDGNRLDSFVLILNQKNNSREQLLSMMTEFYNNTKAAKEISTSEDEGDGRKP
jgi:D-alanyl-D-alanine carboxypeptidase/D-alanyl-D-alanine-endopeptidase (penicillin-binding protein 4)